MQPKDLQQPANGYCYKGQILPATGPLGLEGRLWTNGIPSYSNKGITIIKTRNPNAMKKH
jgi:hypothetical protein